MDTFFKRNMRNRIYAKTDGRCAYSGTGLIAGWVYDKIDPNKVDDSEYGDYDNLLAIQKEIGEYKGDSTVEEFKEKLSKLHIDLKKLPVDPGCEAEIEYKNYFETIASYFGITEKKPFNGIFYYDTVIKSTYEATRKSNDYLISAIQSTGKDLNRVEELRLAVKLAQKDNASVWVVVNLRERIGFELSLNKNDDESI